MKYYLPKDMTLTDTNVDVTKDESGVAYNVYDKTEAYNKGTVVKYGTNVYTSLTDIYKLVSFIWEDEVIGSNYCYDMKNDVVFTTPTAVPIVINVTTVYVRSQDKYYIANKTATVDFTTESYLSPADFTEVDATVKYRNEYNLPSGIENTLYWGYDGSINSEKVFDSSIGTQTENTDSIYYKFTANAISGITILYVDATEIEVKVVDNITLDTVTDQTVDLKDTSRLNTYEKVCTMNWKYTRKAFVQFQARYSQTIEIWIRNTGLTAKVGAIKAGLVDSLGRTVDNVAVSNKSYNEVEQRDDGSYVWNKDEKETNKVFIIGYNMLVKTTSFDTMVENMKEITDKEVVLIGDDSDETIFRTTINYGAITDSSADLNSNATNSNLSVTIENFV